MEEKKNETPSHEEKPTPKKPRLQKTSEEVQRAVVGSLLAKDDGIHAPKAVPDWKDLSPKQKTSVILGWVFILLSIAFVLLVVFAPKVFGENTLLCAITDSSLVNDANRVNVALLSTLFWSVAILGGSALLRNLTSFLFRHASNKSITIVKLLNSTIKYAAAIALVFVILSLWGVDTATILASAGIVALIVGLGAQSLIADIIGGLSIVFEQQFEVGDTVVIDDFRGVVTEIGLTATKIIDAAGNNKIIKNSEITSVINLSHDLSLAIVDIPVDYEEDLKAVRSLLKKELPEVAKRIPTIQGEIAYLGVEELEDSGVLLRFIARCPEQDKFSTTRALNEEILILFREHDVNVPFNQLVISSRKEDLRVPEKKN
jgi:small-conductance mechanosensitive channel